MSWYDPDRVDDTIYKVVINHEEQYSIRGKIWPERRSRRYAPRWTRSLLSLVLNSQLAMLRVCYD